MQPYLYMKSHLFDWVFHLHLVSKIIMWRFTFTPQYAWMVLVMDNFNIYLIMHTGNSLF